MKIIIDRFEGDYAVCEVQEEKRMINKLRTELPEGVKEGDVLVLSESGFSIDVDETKQREKRIKGMMDSLWE